MSTTLVIYDEGTHLLDPTMPSKRERFMHRTALATSALAVVCVFFYVAYAIAQPHHATISSDSSAQLSSLATVAEVPRTSAVPEDLHAQHNKAKKEEANPASQFGGGDYMPKNVVPDISSFMPANGGSSFIPSSAGMPKNAIPSIKDEAAFSNADHASDFVPKSAEGVPHGALPDATAFVPSTKDEAAFSNVDHASNFVPKSAEGVPKHAIPDATAFTRDGGVPKDVIPKNNGEPDIGDILKNAPSIPGGVPTSIPNNIPYGSVPSSVPSGVPSYGDNAKDYTKDFAKGYPQGPSNLPFYKH